MKRLLTTTTIAGALAMCLAVDSAQALPAGGQVRGGQARITSRTGRTTVNQSSERAIIDWSSFNVAQGEMVQFNQPNASAITLNRISDVNPSVIDGTITANGQVWLINPQGIAFGKNAQVNVAGLLATSSDISNSDFMAGNYRFSKPGNASASISNAGSLTAASGGVITLAGPNVSNSGIITANLGKVQLASGDAFTLDLYGDGLINLQASPAITQQLITNSGTINAQGGQVLLTAAAAEAVVNSLINLSGVIDADTAGTQQGQVNITTLGSNGVAGNVAAAKGQLQGYSEVLVSGSISASGKGAGQTGGAITVTADNVGILSGSTIDASGDAGGGTIRIGGDFHGQGTTPTALHTIVESRAVIDASAISTGSGGNVTVWADDWTNFAGSILARGGAFSGNGGYVETSGKINLTMNGSVDVSAVHGSGGTWLMDPADVTISSSDTNINGNATSPNFTPTGAGEATINVSDITTALNNGSNVTITTGGDSYAGAGGGNITVATPITLSASSNNNATLTLSAYSDIVFNANDGITAPTTGTGKLNVILDADNGTGGGGAIVINSGANITTNGGNVAMGGGALSAGLPGGAAYSNANSGQSWAQANAIFINSATINAMGGTITMDGFSNAVNVASVRLSTATVETAGTGNITITGSGNQSEGGIVGLVIGSSSIIENTGTGTITLSGTGGGASINNTGIDFVNGTNQVVSSGGGNITLTAVVSVTGTNDNGLVTAASTNTIGGASNTGDITLQQNSILFNQSSGTTSIQTSGNITVKEYTAGQTIGVGSGAGNLSLTDTYLGYFTFGSGKSFTIGDANAGNITINSANTLLNTGNVTYVSGGQITVSGNISKTAGPTDTLTLEAGTNIVLSSAISGANGYALNVVFDANTANGTSGYITSSANITTYGGDIWMGGGSLDANGHPTGAAIGASNCNYCDGINLTGTTINAAGGNISLTGIGGSGGSGNYGEFGVELQSGATVETSGSGNIAITGTGGAASSIRSAGIILYGGTNFIENSGSGAITLNGFGGNGTGGTNQGVELWAGTNTILATGGGLITLTGIAGTASGSYGGLATGGGGTATIGGLTCNGDIKLIQDSWSLNNQGGTTTIQTSGNITVKEYTANQTIGVGSGAGNLSLSDTYLSYFTFGSGKTFTIGDANAGNITINSANTLLNTGNVTYVSGGSISVAGAISKTAGSTNTLTLEAAQNIIDNHAISGASGYALNVVLDSANVASGNGTSGYINANGGSVSTYGGDIWMGGGSLDANGHPVGAAYGNSSGNSGDGIYIAGGTLNAAGGNIVINGQSGNISSWEVGVYVTGGGTLETSGTEI